MVTTNLQIPCALSSLEKTALQTFAMGYVVAEAGSLLGGSTVQLASTAHKVIAIDQHDGYCGAPTLSPFMSNLFTRSAHDNVVPIVGDARRILPSIVADRYFIDLDGTFETTYATLVAIPPRRLVAVHDLRRQGCSGVEKAILAAGYEIDHCIDTLAFIRKR